MSGAARRRIIMCCWALGALSACAPAVVGDPSRGGGRLRASSSTLREERIVLSDFSVIQSVAVSRRYVFAATSQGLVVRDRIGGGWLPPMSALDGWPVSGVRVMAADPGDDVLFAAGPSGLLIHRPLMGDLLRVVLPGLVDQILFDRTAPGSGAFVQASGRWYRVGPIGDVRPVGAGELPGAAARVGSTTLATVYREFPQLESFGRLMTRDDQFRAWPASAAGRAPERTEVWLGTAGGGLYQVDPLFNQATAHPFGLLSGGGGALARAADGVWIAGWGRVGERRGGLTFAATDLASWRWLESPARVSLAGVRAFDLEVRAGVAWLATERGLLRWALDDPEDVRGWSATTGLPDDVVLAVAARPEGVWVGTMRGLVWVEDVAADRAGRAERVGRLEASGVAIRALLATGDTLWVGSEAGLLLRPPGDSSALVRPSAAGGDRRLLQPVRALATHDSIVAILGERGLFVIEPRTSRLLGPEAFPSLLSLGTLTAIAVDARTIWVGGAKGVLVIPRDGGAARSLRVGSDLPGEVADLALSDGVAWIATREGVVRVRRDAGGQLP